MVIVYESCCAFCAGLRLLTDAEVDEIVSVVEAEKAAAEAARRRTSQAPQS